MNTKHIVTILLILLVLLASHKILVLGVGFILGVLCHNVVKNAWEELTKDPFEEEESV